MYSTQRKLAHASHAILHKEKPSAGYYGNANHKWVDAMALGLLSKKYDTKLGYISTHDISASKYLRLTTHYTYTQRT